MTTTRFATGLRGSSWWIQIPCGQICQVPPVECQPIDPPILAVRAAVNDSPLAGKDGKYITLNALGERLDKEALTNPAIAP